MSEIVQIINKIRDSRLIKIDVDYLKSIVNMTFEKNDVTFNLNLKDISKVDVFDDKIHLEYVSNVKFFKDEKNQYLLSLDPFNESLNQIQEEDNYVFAFKKYSLNN